MPKQPETKIRSRDRRRCYLKHGENFLFVSLHSLHSKRLALGGIWNRFFSISVNVYKTFGRWMCWTRAR